MIKKAKLIGFFTLSLITFASIYSVQANSGSLLIGGIHVSSPNMFSQNTTYNSGNVPLNVSLRALPGTELDTYGITFTFTIDEEYHGMIVPELSHPNPITRAFSGTATLQVPNGAHNITVYAQLAKPEAPPFDNITIYFIVNDDANPYTTISSLPFITTPTTTPTISQPPDTSSLPTPIATPTPTSTPTISLSPTPSQNTSPAPNTTPTPSLTPTTSPTTIPTQSESPTPNTPTTNSPNPTPSAPELTTITILIVITSTSFIIIAIILKRKPRTNQ